MRKLVMRETGRERLGPGSAFRAIWLAWTVSIAGDEVSVLALPLAAAATLDASAFEMGVLSASGTLPFLLFGLLAGVWVDRHRRKPVLVASDVGRGLLLLSIPLAAIFDALTMAQLVVVAFAAGLFNVFFSVASLSILPAVVDRSRLVEANSRMEASQAVVRVAMPGPAGLLIQAVGAPLAIGLDALSFLASGLLVARAGITETAAVPVDGARTRRVVTMAGAAVGVFALWA
ncbi:MAG: MFS transporter, partial [Geminicoccales bacterium]